MGVPFAKIAEAAATIRSEAEYIARQDSLDVSASATEDLMEALLLIADVLSRRKAIDRAEGR